MKMYEVRSVVCDYGIFYGDKLILILNSHNKAKQVCKILNEDMLINKIVEE